MKHRVSHRAGQKSSPPALSRLAEDITAQVLAALREGVRPWQQPWYSGRVPPGQDGRPRRHSLRRYAGINVLLLWLAAGVGGYLSPVWMTYRQAQAYGGQVRRGERGTVIVYADRYRKTVVDEASGEESECLIPFLKTYTVFNVEQIDGLPDKFRPVLSVPLTPAQEAELVAAVEAFFLESVAVIRHWGDAHCYIPAFDEIRLPATGALLSVHQYYATLANELIQWTRDTGRLNRDFGRKQIGDAGYELEELVAEFGAALLFSYFCLTPMIRDDHATYIGHWLQLLLDDQQELFTAAAHAERAVSYLQGRGEAVAESETTMAADAVPGT